jgi:putative flippase GtrA
MSTPQAVDISLARPVGARSLLEFARYFAASTAALAVDAGVYTTMLKLTAPYPVAAAVGFMTGLFLAYALSIGWAFDKRSVRNARVEFALFAGVGVAGLLLTESILWMLVGHLGAGPALGKLCAAGIVFTFNFGARKALLFRAPA